MLDLFWDPNQDVFSFYSDDDHRTAQQMREDFIADTRKEIPELFKKGGW